MAQPYPSTSRGYLSSSRNSNAPGAYYEVMQSDFGQSGPATPTLAYNAGSGSLASGTAYVKITWITAEGESAPSAEASVSISAGSGAFTITQPTVPTNGATIVGWRVYSASTTGGELLNTAPTSTTQAQSTFTINTLGGGSTTISAFPISTTAVQVLIYGTGASAPAVDGSGIQTALPSIAANASADYYFRVPNSASLWRTQKDPSYARPLGYPDPSGISAGSCDILMPLYPGTSASVAAGAYMVMNGYLFLCSTAGTTASTFIGGSAFNQTKGATTTDGTVTWTSYGKACLIRLRFSNSSGSAATPQAQEYDFFAS